MAITDNVDTVAGGGDAHGPEPSKDNQNGFAVAGVPEGGGRSAPGATRRGRKLGWREWKEAKYTREISQMLELSMRGVKTSQIAKVLDRPVSTVDARLRKFREILPELENIEDYTGMKTQLLNALELKILKSMAETGKHTKASINNLAYAFRQVFDSCRLEQNKATQNVSIQHQFTRVELPRDDPHEVQKVVKCPQNVPSTGKPS